MLDRPMKTISDKSRRRTARKAALACALALGLMALPVAPAAAAKAKPTSLYWGAQIGSQLTGEEAPWDMGAVSKFQGLVGKGLSLIQFSAPFADCNGSDCVFGRFPGEPLENIRSYGAIPIFSWSSASSPPSVNQPEFRLSNLIDGRYDSFIREFATKAKEWGHPFFLRFDWEMNGFWFPWNEGVNGNKPGEFVAAWRHVHDIFTSVGATNVTWIWCPNVDIGGNLTNLRSLYPGDAYVDWTGLDGFNWGNRRGSPGWQTFGGVFHSSYRRIAKKIAPGKPMILAEVASSDRGGSKAAWIKNMLNEIRHSYRKIRGLVWYDVEDRGAHWPLETNKQATNAFRKGIKPHSFLRNDYGDLATFPIGPPPR